ncbi:hypothetical protein AB6A40_008660 [Gnathostoma spinigerum]|uniref:BCL2/adenovirus E1B 19 kDa protein-interacting protein 3 n=1 Tax=Gnathostoma spinigerum TaxID=75299 RepID=A0ABD6EQ39_9BILA
MHNGIVFSTERKTLFESRQPPMVDVKKHFGNMEKLPDDRDSMPESWVELAPSRSSLSSSVDAAVMLDNDSHAKEGSRLSPVSLHSPHVEFESNLEQVKYRLSKDVLQNGRGADWIWDWSSRPEAQPFMSNRHNSTQVCPSLSTPPNSPVPGSSEFEFGTKTSVFRIMLGLVVSNLFTFMLGAAIGYYVCKNISRNQKEF